MNASIISNYEWINHKKTCLIISNEKVGTPVEQNMQTSLSKRTIGCIGKCTSGLSIDELDQITDNINKTLNHPRGREIFKKFLEQCDLRDNLECLALFEICFEIIEREQKFL